MEEPGGLQSMGSQTVGHELATKQQHYHSLEKLHQASVLPHTLFPLPEKPFQSHLLPETSSEHLLTVTRH